MAGTDGYLWIQYIELYDDNNNEIQYEIVANTTLYVNGSGDAYTISHTDTLTVSKYGNPSTLFDLLTMYPSTRVTKISIKWEGGSDQVPLKIQFANNGDEITTVPFTLDAFGSAILDIPL